MALHKFLDGDVIAILSRFNCSALAPDFFLSSVAIVSICFSRADTKATKKNIGGRGKEGDKDGAAAEPTGPPYRRGRDAGGA